MAGIKHTIIFRVDANKEVGLGHFTRCLVLALKFQQKGHQVFFIGVLDYPVTDRLNTVRIEYYCMESKMNVEDDLKECLKYCAQRNGSIVVIDHYSIDSRYSRHIMDMGYFVISMNDIGMPPPASHMVINANLNAEKTPLDVPETTVRLLGIKYLLMPAEFQQQSPHCFDDNKVENILVTMGATDHYDLTTRILCLLGDLKGDFSVTIIVGPFFENTENIKTQTRKMKKPVTIAEAPSSLFAYIRGCSLAVSGAGQTLYQFLACSRPTIGISVEDNQAGHLGELVRKNALVGLDYQEEESFGKRFHRIIVPLLEDADFRSRLSISAGKIVDVHGADRIYQAVDEAYKNIKMSREMIQQSEQG